MSYVFPGFVMNEYWTGEIRDRYMSNVPCIALTATATKRVTRDIVDLVRLHPPVLQFRQPVFRDNLFYEVRYKQLLADTATGGGGAFGGTESAFGGAEDPVICDLVEFIRERLQLTRADAHTTSGAGASSVSSRSQPQKGRLHDSPFQTAAEYLASSASQTVWP